MRSGSRAKSIYRWTKTKDYVGYRAFMKLQQFRDTTVTLYKMTPESREEMGRRGQKYVAENHDISVLAGRLENAIESIGKHN